MPLPAPVITATALARSMLMGGSFRYEKQGPGDAVEVGVLEGGEGRRGDRRLEEADEAVEQIGDVDGERDDVVAVGPDPLAVGGGVHAERQRLGDAVGAQRLGDVGEELADLFAGRARVDSRASSGMRSNTSRCADCWSMATKPR